MTAADQRSIIVKARRGPKVERVEVAPPAWEREQWIDEGSLREEASKAAQRAATEAAPRGREPRTELAPEVAEELTRVAAVNRQARYKERLASAAEALDRGRFADARRMVQGVVRDLPEMAFGHEISGLASYRLGQWRKAAAELETARLLDGTVNHHAVLMDCYRALRRYHEVDILWRELREASPAPALLAEGRIVAAGALADQDDLPGALSTMAKALEVPKKPRDYHLRQWYVLADLLDRSGDVIKARRYFGLVAAADPEFADVKERLRTLGR
jgi:tetratricopeptide (TPR) repeat protein